MKLEIPPGDFAGYIFDLDVTLVDTMPLHYRAWDEAMRAVGLMSAGAAVVATGIAGLAWSFNTYDRFQKQQPGQANFGAPTITRSDLSTVRWVYPASWVAAGVGAVAVAAGAVLYVRGTQTTFAVVPSQSGVGLAASGTF